MKWKIRGVDFSWHTVFFMFLIAAATATATAIASSAYRTTRSLTGGELMCVLVVATKSEYSFFSVFFYFIFFHSVEYDVVVAAVIF